MAKKRDEALQRVFCRDCYQAAGFVGNGCFCRFLMSRVCAADRYGHPITFCRGGYLDKTSVKKPKRKAGEVFEYRGAEYVVMAAQDFAAHCHECDLNFYCRKYPDEIDNVAGICRGLIFKKK